MVRCQAVCYGGLVVQRRTVILILSIDAHPHVIEDLPELVPAYLESEGLIKVRQVTWADNNMFETSDLPYIRDDTQPMPKKRR